MGTAAVSIPADMNWRMAICDYVRDSRDGGVRARYLGSSILASYAL